MLQRTRMVSTRQIPAYATGNGFAAICPTCGKDNHAHYGEDGNLVWWPNDQVGTWCRHCEGAYSGGGLSTVFQFKYLPLVASGRYGE